MITNSANADVTLSFGLIENGQSVLSAVLSMRVTGPSGVLQDWTVIPSTLDVTNTIWIVTVPASLNQLGLGAMREARVIEIAIVTSSNGQQIFSQEYLIVQDAEELTPMVNSFQTYVQALTNSSLLVTVPGWDNAEPSARRVAMMNAYDDLSHLVYDLYTERDDVYYRSRASWGLPITNMIGRLYTYSVAEFQALLPDFQRKIALAQVSEADARLAPNEATQFREDGILTKTTGDVSITMQSRKPVHRMLDRRTLLILGPYLKLSPRLTRV